MPNTKTVHVPHLGGIDVGYQTAPVSIDPTKPTVIMVNSFMTSSDLYRSQFANSALTDKMNLVAMELLGHGQTRTDAPGWTYWDTAIMNLQAMEKLGIEKAFVLGTSQGGWICARMALLAPERIIGIIPLGTSMDYESERTRKLGCWDCAAETSGSINAWSTLKETPEFEPDDGFCNFLFDIGFGKDCPKDVRDFWKASIKSVYKGDKGRRNARMAAINLRERDGLHGRLFDVRCPVLWLHGTADEVYTVANAEEEIKLFVNSPDVRLVTVEGGAHFLSSSNPKEVDENLLEFVGKYA